MLEELCKWIQHCCATLRRSRNKRNVVSCWFKCLTGFKLSRLRVVPYFYSGIVERAWKYITPREKRRHAAGDFHACRLFSRGVIFTRAPVSLALLSLRKNGGLLVVYKLSATTPYNTQQHATTCNRVCKRTQHVTSTIELLANNIAFVCTGLSVSTLCNGILPPSPKSNQRKTMWLGSIRSANTMTTTVRIFITLWASLSWSRWRASFE